MVDSRSPTKSGARSMYPSRDLEPSSDKSLSTVHTIASHVHRHKMLGVAAAFTACPRRGPFAYGSLIATSCRMVLAAAAAGGVLLLRLVVIPMGVAHAAALIPAALLPLFSLFLSSCCSTCCWRCCYLPYLMSCPFSCTELQLNLWRCSQSCCWQCLQQYTATPHPPQ